MKTKFRNLVDRAKGNKPSTTGGTIKPKYPWLPFASLCIAALLMFFVPALLMAGLTAKVALLIAFPEGQVRSGKSGTTVFNKNGTQRVWKYPKLVRNAFTTAVRSSLASLSSMWKSLGQSQMDGWNNAVGYTRTNRIGQTLAVKGKRLFVMLNQNLSFLGISANNDYPGYKIQNTLLFGSAPTMSVGGATFIIPFSNALPEMGCVYEATPMLSAGVNRPAENKFRIFKADADASTPSTSANLYTAYVNRFGAPAVGSTIFVKATAIDNVTGGASASSEIIKVVVAA